MYVSREHGSNSGLAQEPIVLVDKTHMVAERCLSLRCQAFSPPASRAEPAMSFDGTPNFVMTAQRVAQNEQNVETMAMMAGAAITARATFIMAGRTVNYIWDKAKNMWCEEKPTPLSMAVETYQMSSSVSLLTSPITSPKKDVDEQ